MSIAGRLAVVFPALHLLLMGACALSLVWQSGPLELKAAWVIALLFVTYGLPVAIYRIVDRIEPIRAGMLDLGVRRHLPWWTSVHLQWIFVAVPPLEGVLRAVPGLYSAWLRCWGSRIGHGVAWPPCLDVLDRGLLEIGDRVVIGHRVLLTPHSVNRRRGRYLAYIGPIRIGSDVLIGGRAAIGPGARIGDRAHIGHDAILTSRAVVPADATVEPRTKVDAGRRQAAEPSSG